MSYDFEKLKAAVLFNTAEVLPGDEKQLDEELRVLVDEANKSGQKIRHYIGFEISGQIHIGGGFFPMMQAAKLQQAGVDIILWIADYHTWLNKKLDGKMETIKKVARTYFGPVMQKCFEVAGGDINKVIIKYNFDDYRLTQNDSTFWDYEFQCESKITLNRVLRSMSIMGREFGQDVDYQMTRYPGMQCADVFWLQTHICQGGLDQRKIYVSARDVAGKIESDYQLKIGDKPVSPICVLSPLLFGLEAPEVIDGVMHVGKMSKSKPDSAVWVHDSTEEISRKLKKAYCPMPNKEQTKEQMRAEQAFNPILDWSKNMIFPAGKVVEIKRKTEYGGDITYSDYSSLEADYFSGKLHPMDLKSGVAICLGQWFAPIREFVEQNPEGLELVRSARKS